MPIYNKIKLAAILIGLAVSSDLIMFFATGVHVIPVVADILSFIFSIFLFKMGMISKQNHLELDNS